MSQDNAAYMLAYMGLFLGIDAAGKLDEAERTQFTQRYEFLKKTGEIPPKPALTAAEWKSLSAYYLGLARYPFVSSEKSRAIDTVGVPFADQGVTMLRRLNDGRIAIGGGVSGLFAILNASLKTEFEVRLDTPPVHVEEADQGFYVLTLGSHLGSLGNDNRAALNFIDPRSKTARRILPGLERSAHFILADINADGRRDFVVGGFGSISGGGILLFESTTSGYQKKTLSNHGSIVRLAELKAGKGRLEFLALAGGAREALIHIVLDNGTVRERTLVEYPPHLGSVWLELADLNGDGQKEVLVLSGDNADAGPFNEVKPDQGLRIYTFDGANAKQLRFESLPGALTLSVSASREIMVSRFYADVNGRQDLTILKPGKDWKFERSHYTLVGRPTMAIATPCAAVPACFLVGTGNFPLLGKVAGYNIRT